MGNINRVDINSFNTYSNSWRLFTEPPLLRKCLKEEFFSLIGEKIHEMLKYAYHHGVSKIYLENLSVLGKLKLLWIKNGRRFNENYNYAVQTFRSKVIEMIRVKAPLYGMKPSYVNPANTSKIGEELMKKLGVDRHTASAYIIALKGLKLLTLLDIP